MITNDKAALYRLFRQTGTIMDHESALLDEWEKQEYPVRWATCPCCEHEEECDAGNPPACYVCGFDMIEDEGAIG